MLTGGLGYSYNVHEHAAADADQPGRLPGHGAATATGGADGQQPNKTGGLIVIAPNVAEGRHRLHRPPADRRRRALQQVPPGTRHVHRRRLPRRTAQRRDDLLVVPQAEPDQQRLVGGLHLLRPRDPCGRQARNAVHLARIEHDGVVRRRQVSGRPEQLRDLPPAGHLRLRPPRRPAPCRTGCTGPWRPASSTAPPGTLTTGCTVTPTNNCLATDLSVYLAVAVHCRRQRDQLRRRLRLQCRDGRDHHRRADDAGQLPDRDGVLRLPRLDHRAGALRVRRRFDLRAAQHRTGHDRDLHGLPRCWPHRRHQGDARKVSE